MARGRLSLRRRWVLPGLIAAAAIFVAGAGGAAALEADTVGSFWQGVWWATSLMTTVGFVHGAPRTVPGAILSAVLMVAGFLLLSLVSAALASLFVREDTAPYERADEAREEEILRRLAEIQARLESLEHGPSLGGGPGGSPSGAAPPYPPEDRGPEEDRDQDRKDPQPGQ